MRRWPLVALWAGFVLQIAAWMLITPPYATYDEFDHAFRVSSTWNGNLAAVTIGKGGASGLVEVDRTLALDAAPECRALGYTTDERCLPRQRLSADTVAMASGAAFYNPLYYVAMSPAAALGRGAATVMWMRAWSLGLTSAVMGLALCLVSRWPARDRAVRGLLLGAPPMLFISMSVVAPNGLEMAAGLLLWVALISLTDERRSNGIEWFALGLAFALLTNLRSLGPFFVVTALGTVALWRGPRVRALWRDERLRCASILAAGAAFMVLSLVWILSQHAPQLAAERSGPDAGLVDALMVSLRHLPEMLDQFIAAVSGRGVHPSPVLVATWLLPFVLLLSNLRVSSKRAVASWATLCLIVLLFPIVFQTMTLQNLGYVWQSRYLLPLTWGVPLIASLLGREERRRLAINDAALVACVGLVQLGAFGSGVLWYRDHSPSVRAGTFPDVPSGIALSVLVLGLALGAAALIVTRLEHSETDRPYDTDRAPIHHSRWTEPRPT